MFCICNLGSHSHLLACLDMTSGDLLWKMRLGDRIESSACLSPCGRFVAVGCYDGYLYFLSISNGEVITMYANMFVCLYVQCNNNLVMMKRCGGVLKLEQK